ncbi:hypothetical protein FIBSPDRAFT_1050827 [Athelia psychrophila]|uniref:C2 domain-containing protein n=1 Tax=Athelia psychrophila TaxID=1759441 RepID=A0A166A9Q5_9AGAM|nr:hypothetical protein FIBSPDRAFT_1050827 [Fibularhizoctonia sp. CBS 109695]
MLRRIAEGVDETRVSYKEPIESIPAPEFITAPMTPESEPPLVAYTLQIISADDLPLRRFKIFREPRRNVFVKAKVGDSTVQTEVCMSTLSPKWKETFKTEARDASSKISLELFDSALRSTSSICTSEDITIKELLKLCRYGKAAKLDLQDGQSRPKGHIKIHLSLSRSGSWSADEAEHLSSVLARQPKIATGGYIDAVDGLLGIDFPTPPAMAAQSIQNVIDKLENFMRIADAVSEVHPYAKGAVVVLTAVYKIIVAQLAIDQSVADLFQTMQDVYSFVDAIEAVPSKIKLLEKIIERILIQTAECGRLIQEYSGHGFAGRCLRETMGASTPDKVAAMAQNLTTLRGQFDTGVAVNTAVVCFRIQTDVTTLVENQTLDKLGSSVEDLSYLSTCHPGTRCDVIHEILEWASNPPEGDNSNVFVSMGLREWGRALWLQQLRHSQLSTAVKSLARQLAEYDGRFRASLVEIIKDRTKALVLRKPLATQFDVLIVKPLASISTLPGEGPIAIVFDGLYKCGQPDDWASLLALIIGQTESLPSNLRFIFTSRTVNGTSTMSNPRIKSRELRSSSYTDISAYFTFRMQQIRRKNEHLQEDWPGRAAIAELSARAFGFFAWAVNASNFLDAHSPPNRLQFLLVQQFSSIPDLTTPLDEFYRDLNTLNTPLDELYMAALNSAGSRTDADFARDSRAIMSAILGSPIAISRTAIHHLLDRSLPPLSAPVMVTIRRLGSVLSYGPAVQVLHPSFLDFLSSHKRCGLDWCFEHVPVRPGPNAGPATLCLQRMNAGLKRNICNLTFSARLTTEELPEELEYACESWVDHIFTDDTFESGEMEKLMVIFLHTYLLHWFEAMILLKKSEEIVPMLQRVAIWLEENTFEDKSLKDLVIEAIDFARGFAAEIAEHPLYVYYAALPLLPSHSMLYRLFHDVLVDPSTLLVTNPDTMSCLALSTNGRRIVTEYSCHTIVRDTATGEELLHIAVTGTPHSVAFSYNGSCIACGTDKSTVYVWDSVTGARVIGPLSHSGSSEYVNVVAWSTDGECLLSGCHTGEVILWNITSPNGNRPITKIHHPGCSEHENGLSSLVFSSDGSQIASCSTRGDVHVWDSKTGGTVWSVQDPQGSDPSGGVSFLSSDRREFVVVKTKERTQVHDASTGKLCPLPGSLVGAVGLTRDGRVVDLLIEGIKKQYPQDGTNPWFPEWVVQGEYFAFAGEELCHVVHLPKSFLY